MKAIILAGGLGTRLSEETIVKPKPMVEIGGKPIIWHIMKVYYSHGIREFIICCGYRGHILKEYFSNYLLHNSDVTFDMKNNNMEVHENSAEDWRVTLIDTGDATMTGGRLKRVEEFVNDGTFCMTYGDGVTNLNISESIKFHQTQNTLATLTAVQPPGRYGAFTMSECDTKIDHFREKPKGDNAWINGGFFVLEPGVFEYISDDSTVWEQEPLTQLAHDSQLSAFRHDGFWQSMDTLRDKSILEDFWKSGNPPWKTW